jgi:hypothetical protein
MAYQAMISDDGREFIVVDDALRPAGRIRPGCPPHTKTWRWEAGHAQGEEDAFHKAVEAIRDWAESWD